MLNHPTLDKLKTLKLYGMIQGLLNQEQHPAIDQMSFEERLGLLVDREMVDSTPKCNPSAHAASCNVSAKNTV